LASIATRSQEVFGTLETIDVIRRNAHEAHHHLQDIRGAAEE
jgi:hypothetical protein